MGGRVAIVADRISWEERRLLSAGPDAGLEIEWANDEALCLGDLDAAALSSYDAVLIRSRSYTRGGLLATLAKSARILTLNSPEAIHACENKLVLRALLREAGVPVPDFRLVVSRKDFEKAVTELPFPLVLKPVFGGMGKRVTLLRDADTAQSVYDYVEDLGHAFEQACLVEPYLGSRSVRCLVVGREPVAIAEFQSNGTDWRNNAAIGSTHRALTAEPELVDLLGRVVDCLGEGIYGVDLFRTGDGFLVNEVNHAPGFRAVATASDIDVAAAISKYVRERLR